MNLQLAPSKKFIEKAKKKKASHRPAYPRGHDTGREDQVGSQGSPRVCPPQVGGPHRGTRMQGGWETQGGVPVVGLSLSLGRAGVLVGNRETSGGRSQAVMVSGGAAQMDLQVLR